jgi:acetyltransferase-like isoleucine patch superfamily enzyme
MEQIRLENYYPDVAFGDGVQICGIRNTAIGAGSCVGDGVWINVCNRDANINMRIGKCVLIGRRGVINTSGFLEIGNYCIFGPNVYVGDADHIYTNIYVPILTAGATENRSAVIEENCWLAMNSVVSGNLVVGRGSVVGANTVVNKSVPPFSVVVGNPSKIVKMFDPLENQWVSIKSEADREKVLANRDKSGLVSRQEYREILSKANYDKISPIVAGRQQHIL